jgi:glycosyltransferase involved in cell wall biosynthesis
MPSPAKKILFVSHEATRTGAPMVLLHLLRWLRRETKQEFELLLVKGGPLKPEFEKVAKLHTPETLAELPESAERAFWGQFHLIYANSCWSHPILEELHFGDIPVITHLHELDCSIDGFGAAKFAGLVRRTHHYIACAKIIASRLQRGFGIPADRISVHYAMIAADWVASNVSSASAETLRNTYDLPEDAFVVSACGTIDVRKAPDMFVQMAARLHRHVSGRRPLRFIWIGKTTDIELRRMLDYDIQRLGLQREIKFVGELAGPHGLLALSDVFCVTSREDPFPLVMLEAAALAKPVVCFEAAGGAGEFCALGGGVAVPLLDVAAMSDQCLELMDHPEQRREMGQRGAASVRARFTVNAVAPSLWREVENFLQKSNSTPLHRVNHDGLADIFATWLLEEAPERAYIRAHLARQAVRRQAQELLAEGRRPEAINLLIRSARTDMETKSPRIVLESLIEIGEDLAPFDAAKARYLQGEAEKMTQRARANNPASGPIIRRIPEVAVLQAG